MSSELRDLAYAARTPIVADGRRYAFGATMAVTRSRAIPLQWPDLKLGHGHPVPEALRAYARWLEQVADSCEHAEAAR
jgi:hypothetical protein